MGSMWLESLELGTSSLLPQEVSWVNTSSPGLCLALDGCSIHSFGFLGTLADKTCANIHVCAVDGPGGPCPKKNTP